jgi:hypothetical protein
VCVCVCLCVCARAHIYINRVRRVVLVVFSPNLYFSLSTTEVFLMPGKRDKVLTALLVLRYTSSSVATQEQIMRCAGVGWMPSCRRRKILLLPPLVPAVRVSRCAVVVRV